MKLAEDIKDNYIIIKYGFTDDLVRRTNEHIKTYGSIKGAHLELMNYIYIDPKYLSQAETDIKDFFRAYEKQITYEKYNELVAIDPKNEKQIKKQFKNIGKEYAGCVKEMVDQIEKLNNSICNQKKEIEHIKETQKLELKNKDMEIQHINEKYRLELKNKDMEIQHINEKYKLEMENYKLKIQLMELSNK